MQIKDFRATPSPTDFPVIREPGNFTGWTLTVETQERGPFNVEILRSDTTAEVASKLRLLAERIE